MDGADKDPERLVAEALRAQAARTPLRENDMSSDTTPVLGGGYGLLSGSEVGWGGGQGIPLAAAPDEATVRKAGTEATARIEPDRRVHAALIVLLAVLLGLAAGAVVGLLTLI